MMKIAFSNKVCETHFDEINSQYLSKSQSEDNIKFDFSITEWISTEEIAFVFAWIRELRDSGKKVIVSLPFPYSKFEQDTPQRVERRKRLNVFLLAVWGMLSKLHMSSDLFENILDEYNRHVASLEKYGVHKIIPFTIIDCSRQGPDKVLVDKKHQELIAGELTDSNEPLFHLESELVTLLTDNLCYSPFESKIISHVLNKELFINAIEHSGKPQCYTAVSMNGRWDNVHSPHFKEHFTQEKHPDAHNFYKDKSVILNKAKAEVAGWNLEQRQKITQKREIDISNFEDDFRNLSYLEFTFLDFGNTIPKTLETQFDEKTSSIEPALSKTTSSAHKDSRVLEFAFLLDSSKDPYSREIEYSELIPRGLYFVVDMVRRYKGLITARSRFGKVTYDFSDRVYITKDNRDNVSLTKDRIYDCADAVIPNAGQSSFFPGTMISIVLPERPSSNLRKSSVRLDNEQLNHYIFNRDNSDLENFPKKVFEPQEYHYLSMAFLHYEALESLSTEDIQSKNGVESFMFKKIDEKLSSLKGVNCILFIDFAFLPERDNYLKILAYLTNTPKVNEFTKVIITNLSPEENIVIKEFKQRLTNEPLSFLFKPIPCISFDTIEGSEILIKAVSWIGLKDAADEELLTQVFFGEKESIPASSFRDSWVAEGNTTASYDERVYSVFDSFASVCQHYIKSKNEFSVEWLKTSIEDGEYTKEAEKRENPHVFLTARSSYQLKYISLYETLHYKYIADFFAKALLDNYLNRFYRPATGEKKPACTFNKIVVVTVSSQLIGVAIRNLIKRNEAYKFLRSGDKSAVLSNCPELIRLASYFSFQEEKPFENISEGDEVIIVNDVISTGSLVRKLIEGIKKKGATLQAVMSMVDCRDNSANEDQIESEVFHEHIERLMITLMSSSEHDFEISKFASNPKPDYQIKRINPVLNTVVELNTKHSEADKILFSDPKKFMQQDFFRSEFLKIGHFQQNITHNSYYTDMKHLFRAPNGQKVLSAVKERIEENRENLKLADNYILGSDTSDLDTYLSKTLQPDNYLKSEVHVDQIRESLNEIMLLLNKEKGSSSYQPDFIVHPVFSGIEEVEDNVFQEVFKTDKDNIISLQRYDTNNGWRFPFPAKRFNKITKNKHILILDSGSLSGHSLVQLVDAISFLEVRRIDFVSIIGRIDDFQREFQSRLRNIKVKPLKSRRDAVIPVNVLFGVNLHIPPFRSPNECPYCQEIESLELINQKRITPHAKRYIEERLQNEISLQNRNSGEFTPSYLPRYKGQVDTAPIVEMRDKLGKVESYRFYEDYFTDFDEMANNTIEDVIRNKDLTRKYELVLICVLHEPKLHDTVKDLLSNVYKLMLALMRHLVLEQGDMKVLFYDWPRYSLVRLLVQMENEQIFNLATTVDLLTFCQNDSRSINFMSYIFLEPLYEKKVSHLHKRSLLVLTRLSRTWDKSDVLQKKEVSEFVNELLMIHEPVKEGTTPLQALYNLQIFFNGVYIEQHYRLLKQDISHLSIIIDNRNIHAKDDIIARARSILNRIKEYLVQNLNVIKKSEIYDGIPERLKGEIFEEEDSVLGQIHKVERAFVEADSHNREQVQSRSTLFKSFESFRTELKKLQRNHLTRGQQFYQFANGYSVELKMVVKQARENSIVQSHINERKQFKIVDNIPPETLVAGNEQLLLYIFHEIFENAAKRPEHDDTTLTLSMSELIDERFWILTIHQNKPWLISSKQKGQGGQNKIIESLIKGIYNKDALEEFKNPDEYIMKIKLNESDLTDAIK